MTTKITKKIVSFKVLDKPTTKETNMNKDEAMTDKNIETKVNVTTEAVSEKSKCDTSKPVTTIDVNVFTEKTKRPKVLSGTTTKIDSSPICPHAVYVTINDMITTDGKRVPYEIFLNSKGSEHFQWVVLCTRLISAVLRKGGDIAFLPQELKNVFDPKGGYFRKGKMVPSLVYEIGEVLEQHLIGTGHLTDHSLTPKQKRELREGVEKKLSDSIAKKKKSMLTDSNSDTTEENVVEKEKVTLEPLGRECHKCYASTVIRVDNCDTCLTCGDSKCG